MRAADEPLHALLQVIKAHGVVTRITAGRLQPHPGGENIPDLQQAQAIEPDQWYLLSELIYGDGADSEDRDSVDAIDAVVACGIRAQDVRVQVTAAYSGRELVRALAKDGWEIARISGSHHVMRHPDGRRVSIPVHGNRPLPARTLASICRSVGRTAQELQALI